jgi:hypothetical protein
VKLLGHVKRHHFKKSCNLVTQVVGFPRVDREPSRNLMCSAIAHFFDGEKHGQDPLYVVAEVRFKYSVFIFSENCYQGAKIPSLGIVTDFAAFLNYRAEGDDYVVCRVLGAGQF